MKKRIASFLALLFVLTPTSPLMATSDTSFLEALGNLTAIEDHKLVQSFYGSLEFEEDQDHITAEYRLSISSTVDDGSRSDSFSRLSAFLKFVNHNAVTDSTPFKEMTIQANGEIITRGQEDIYLKLNNFNIGLTEALPFAVSDVEEVKATVDLYRGTWYHTAASELALNEYDEEAIEIEEYIALEEQMKEEPKEAIIGLTELALEDSEMMFSEDEISQFMDAVSILLEAKLFTQRDIVAGRNTDFRFFNLNKGAIMDIMSEIAEAMGEEMTIEDRAAIRLGLGKFSLSGIYRVDDTYDIIDNLLVRFKLHDVESLRNMELNYRFKVWDINKETSVKAPTDFEEFEDVFGGLYGDYYEDDYWYEDEYYDDYYYDEELDEF